MPCRKAAPRRARRACAAASSGRRGARLRSPPTRGARRSPRGKPRRSNHAPRDLVGLDRLEQRAEIALAEALVALALDDLEEDRADDGFGEDLQEQAARRIAVDEDPALAQLFQ